MDQIEKLIHDRYKTLEEQTGAFGIWTKTNTKAELRKEPRSKSTEMKNKIQDLRDHLFETIEKLKDGEIDLDKAKAIAEIAQVVVNSAKVEVDFLRAVGNKESYFFPVNPDKQLGS